MTSSLPFAIEPEPCDAVPAPEHAELTKMLPAGESIERVRGAYKAAALKRWNSKPDLTNRKPLRAWEYRFAEWLVVQPKMKVKVAEALNKMHELSGEEHSRKSYANLRTRREFRAYLQTLQESIREVAKVRLADTALEYINAHKDGLDMALGEKDYRAIYRYTTPIITNLLGGDKEQAAVVVSLVLSEAQRAAHDLGVIDVDYEVVSETST